MSKDLNYQLGCLAAEYFIMKDLPTLSTDMLKSNNVIEVSEDLTKQWEEREAKYAADSTVFYENLKWYKENIERVYLEEYIEIRVPKVDPTDLKAFGEGFEQALWDCDYSHYKYVKMLPNKESAWCSTIKLKRND